MEMKMKKRVSDIVLCLIGAILLFTLVRRLYYTVSHYDEVFNIYVSYMTVGMGKRHLIENEMMMSMGNLFNLPFISIFYHITGGMEGIVLFMRYMYLGLNLLLAAVFYGCFHRQFGKRTCILFGLVFVSYAPFSIYSIWYDSVALFFLLAGCMLFLAEELNEEKKFRWMKYPAGICHACMVYAYPTMAGVILVIFVGKLFFQIRRKTQMKEIFFYWLPYLLGGLSVVAVLALYILYVGWENIFLLQKESAEIALGGRILGDITEETADNENVMSTVWVLLGNVFGKLRSILTAMWRQQKAALGITVLLLIQWGIGLWRKGIIRILLLLEIILTAVWFHNGMGQWATQTMYAYYFLWTPFLYCYLEKEERKKWGSVMLLLDGAAIAALLAVGFTAYYDMKASMGLYSGAIGAFLLMVLIAKNREIAGKNIADISWSVIIIFFLAGCNIFMLYQNVYENEQVSKCNYLMQKGIYKGIMAQEEDAIYEILPELFAGIELKEDATLYTNDFVYMPAFIEGKLLFNGGNPREPEGRIQAGEDIETVYREFEWTDVIIMDNATYEECPNVVEYILPKYYELIHREDNFYMYVRKESRV